MPRWPQKPGAAKPWRPARPEYYRELDARPADGSWLRDGRVTAALFAILALLVVGGTALRWSSAPAPAPSPTPTPTPTPVAPVEPQTDPLPYIVASGAVICILAWINSRAEQKFKEAADGFDGLQYVAIFALLVTVVTYSYVLYVRDPKREVTEQAGTPQIALSLGILFLCALFAIYVLATMLGGRPEGGGRGHEVTTAKILIVVVALFCIFNLTSAWVLAALAVLCVLLLPTGFGLAVGLIIVAIGAVFEAIRRSGFFKERPSEYVPIADRSWYDWFFGIPDDENDDPMWLWW